MTLKQVAIFAALIIPFFFLTVWALVDVSSKKFPSSRQKAAWWIVAMIPFIGWLPYLLFGSRKGKRDLDF